MELLDKFFRRHSNGDSPPDAIERNLAAKEFLAGAEGKAWQQLSREERREALKFAALAELDPEDEERLRALVPAVADMSEEDRKLYVATMKSLGLMTEKEA